MKLKLNGIDADIYNIKYEIISLNDMKVLNNTENILYCHINSQNKMNILYNNGNNEATQKLIEFIKNNNNINKFNDIIHYLHNNNNNNNMQIHYDNNKLRIIVSIEYYTQFITTLKSYLCNDINDNNEKKDNINNDDMMINNRERWWWYNHRQELIDICNNKYPNASGVYVYNMKEVNEAIKRLKQLTSIDCIFYAMKANANISILECINDNHLGFECVSLQELLLINKKFPNAKKLFTPNFASINEYKDAFKLNHTFITIDNLWVTKQWPDVFKNKEILIRVDPGHGAGHHAHVRTGGSRSKFGVSVDELIENYNYLTSLNCQVIGLHIHAGSGVFDINNWTENAKLLVNLCDIFINVQYINLGGGLGIPYKPNQKYLNLQKVNNSLLTFKNQMKQKNIQFWMEPGRYIVAEAGVLLAHVTQLKYKPGRDFVGISCGMNALIRPALYDAYHHIVNLNQIDKCDWKVDIVGPICETGDFLNHDIYISKETKPNDILLIACTGAYGYCMSSDYNNRHHTIVEETIF